MDNLSPPSAFYERAYYSAHFMDPELWEPFVRHVAGCHGFECHCILPGLPGSFPTFIVEQGQPAGSAQTAFVVKFFGPLFEGKDSFYTELAMGHFIAKHDLNIPSPVILAEGRLSSDWYYLVFEYIPGDSMGQVYQEMSKDALQGVAMQMGKFMHQLHALTATSLPVIPPATRSLSWEDYADFLEKQRADCLDHHRSWNDLPSQLLDLLPGYIPPIEQLLDYTSPPHLIHGDLTADHLLGWLQAPTPVSTRLHSAGSARDATTVGQPGKGWESLAIIDWGDCRVGNILYELAAVHLDLFRADKRLLRLCLQAYGLPIFYQLDFARKAFSTVLLHQFPMPAHIYSPYQDARSLDELADGLFGISFGSETH